MLERTTILSRPSLSTGLTVTAVAVLIWLLAARATTDDLEVGVSVRLHVPGGDRWTVDPDIQPVEMLLRGPTQALRRADGVLSNLDKPIDIHLRAEPQEQEPINLLERLRAYQPLAETGARVESVDPATVYVTVDRIVDVDADIVHGLPTEVHVESAKFTPPVARLEVPGALREQLPEEILVEVEDDPAFLDGLEPGVWHERQVRLALPRNLPGRERVKLVTRSATMSIKLASRIRRITRDDVRVHLAGPHEDFREFTIEIEPSVLKGVTLDVDGEIADRIERGEMQVVAVLHLTNRDKVMGIKKKPLAYYMALENGWEQGRLVRSPDPPREIALTIAPRP